MLTSLNDAQFEAVTAKPGNLLVLAGAGSGKTRVLVQRIAWLIKEHGASPYNIVAVTFTNKAAHEMQHRLNTLLHLPKKSMLIGTFHGIAHHFLRLHCHECELKKEFQVIDSDEQLKLLKKIVKEKSLDEEVFEAKKIQYFINGRKDEGIRYAQLGGAKSHYQRVLGEVYLAYESLCYKEHFVDFAELLLRVYELFTRNSELLQHYQSRLQHFLVDEFQDTNTIQYMLLTRLCGKSRSLTVVGDDDQSIYGWRGAKIENIKKFQTDFHDVLTIRLERNYRSTQIILDAANAVIAHNTDRLGKHLWTEANRGIPISIYHALNEEDEALYVVRHIAKLKENYEYNDIALLYRSNAQSRMLEDALMRGGIPYKIYGGVRFFERQEIKDLLAYLRLAVNPADNNSLLRVINLPARGIGSKSIETIQEIANIEGISLWEALQKAGDTHKISQRAYTGAQEFLAKIALLNSKVNTLKLADFIQFTLETSGLKEYFSIQAGESSLNRADNLLELINAARDYCLEQNWDNKLDDLSILLDFLNYVALDGGESKEVGVCAVQLMTLHSAKGLEFPVVFICGMEEDLFPHKLCMHDPLAIEEERRLCYVGITRAMEKLFITRAERRRIFGRDEPRRISRFLAEIPKELTHVETKGLSIYRHKEKLPESLIKPAIEEHGTIRLGATIKHPKFGTGKVIDQEGKNERTKIRVQFAAGEPKWLMLISANVEVL